MLMKKHNTKMFPRFTREVCMACTMCVDACPKNALDIQVMNSINGFRLYPYLRDENECSSCGSCQQECPVNALSMK